MYMLNDGEYHAHTHMDFLFYFFILHIFKCAYLKCKQISSKYEIKKWIDIFSGASVT